MAPEQMERPGAVDHRADIYSLGVVFYELLTGELPLGRFAPPSRKAQVDVRLDEVVLRALERDPVCRYQHVSEVKTAVESLRQASGPGGEAAPGPGMERRVELSLLLTIALSLALLALGLWWTGSEYCLLGIPLVAWYAALPPWRPALRQQAGALVLIGGIAVTLFGFRVAGLGAAWVYAVVASLSYSPVYSLMTGKRWPESKPDAVSAPPSEAGRSPKEARILEVLERFQSDANLHLVPDIPAELLHNARRSSKVPPGERVLGVLDFTDDEDDGSLNLLFGDAGVYFHTEHKGEQVTGSVPYEEFPRRSFVNHGKEVYLGGGLALAPPEDYDTVSCETIADLLNALKGALRASGTPGTPEGGPAEA
jgi:hypothetical protein